VNARAADDSSSDIIDLLSWPDSLDIRQLDYNIVVPFRWQLSKIKEQYLKLYNLFIFFLRNCINI
jgi:hypothetical protein